MCLTIPGRIVAIEHEPGGNRARIEYPGALRSASLLFLPEAKVGDYVLVRSGFVTDRLEERDALEALAYVREMEESARPATTAVHAGE